MRAPLLAVLQLRLLSTPSSRCFCFSHLQCRARCQALHMHMLHVMLDRQCRITAALPGCRSASCSFAMLHVHKTLQQKVTQDSGLQPICWLPASPDLRADHLLLNGCRLIAQQPHASPRLRTWRLSGQPQPPRHIWPSLGSCHPQQPLL